MDWKKFGRALLFPHMAVLSLLLPIAAFLLGYGTLYLEETNPVQIAAYALSFYTLVIWCVRIPAIVRFFLNFKEDNKYVKRWLTDARLRINVSLTGNILWNGAYAALQLGLGVYHRSAWFYSLAAYYFSLALMRFFLARHIARYKPGERMRKELRRYRACGRAFLMTNAALSAMIFFMIHQNRLVRHHEITTIAMAAYTFTSLTVSIINVVKYRRLQSPVFSASKAIALASACVSMLTLEGTMLATFGGENMTRQIQRLFLSLSGGAVSIFIVTMAIYMIVKSNQKIKCLENENGEEGDL